MNTLNKNAARKQAIVWNSETEYLFLEPNVPKATKALELKFLILTNMKKEYLTPEMRIAYVGFEVNFLASEIGFGGSTGEDLDDPDDPFDPWS